MLKRSTWNSFKLFAGTHVLLTLEDLKETPLVQAPTFLFGTAGQSGQKVQLSIYRADLRDAPEVINVDTFDVWHDLRSRFDVMSIVNAGSTSTGPNLDYYLDGHVFLAAQHPGKGHHLQDLPDEIVVLLKDVAG
jgi:hypothetical protein